MLRKAFAISATTFLMLLVSVTAYALEVSRKTSGEQFRDAMTKLVKSCAARKDVSAGDSSCDILKLKPYDALATPEGRFAHKIKLPPPHDKPKEVYRKGMSSEQYFKALCEAEAGEFIFRIVDNVEGILQMRPRELATDNMLMHLNAMEDPYGHLVGVRRRAGEYFVQPPIGKYQFLEELIVSGGSSTAGASYRQYYRNPKAHPRKDYPIVMDGRDVRVPYIVAERLVKDLRSQYGYTWRGIMRPYDRELGIAGNELIILELAKKEVLAFRRSFVRTGNVKNLSGIWWLTSQHCSAASKKLDSQFITEVLKPIR